MNSDRIYLFSQAVGQREEAGCEAGRWDYKINYKIITNHVLFHQELPGSHQKQILAPSFGHSQQIAADQVE